MRHVRIENSFDAWRDAARRLLIERVPPEQVLWTSDESDQSALFAADPRPSDPSDAPPAGNEPRVPARFVETARRVACHRDPQRWPLLYRVLYRLQHEERRLLEVETDDDVRGLTLMEQQVRLDAHKMKAFVRFRKTTDAEGVDCYIAWHVPAHFVLGLTAPFFAERFAAMRWSILTPDASAHWDLREIRYGPGVPRSAAPSDDELENFWRTYYASIFNPARVKLGAMFKEMPRRYWDTMPETQLIPELIRKAGSQVNRMLDVPDDQYPGAERFLPAERSLESLRSAVQSCRGCPLHAGATQPVFGEGPPTARAMLIGEQPGDQEDVQGRPFVGPAGQLLAQALTDVGIAREELYLTNTVKHFKWKQQGRRRIHETPRSPEIHACVPWLQSEIGLLQPKLIVCLGSTAARAVIGPEFRVTRDRGKVYHNAFGPWIMGTYHPSALLRIPDAARRAATHAEFLADLRLLARELHALEP